MCTPQMCVGGRSRIIRCDAGWRGTLLRSSVSASSASTPAQAREAHYLGARVRSSVCTVLLFAGAHHGACQRDSLTRRRRRAARRQSDPPAAAAALRCRAKAPPVSRCRRSASTPFGLFDQHTAVQRGLHCSVSASRRRMALLRQSDDGPAAGGIGQEQAQQDARTRATAPHTGILRGEAAAKENDTVIECSSGHGTGSADGAGAALRYPPARCIGSVPFRPPGLAHGHPGLEEAATSHTAGQSPAIRSAAHSCGSAPADHPTGGTDPRRPTPGA